MKRLAWLLALALAPLASCGGGDDDGPSCSAFTACGGDVVGTWNIDGVCNVSFEIPECPTAELLAFPQPTGMVTFNSDGTYTAETTTSGMVRVRFPASCLMGATSCADLNVPDEGVTCEGNVSESCTCEQTLMTQMETESGAYTVSGNTLTLTPTGGTANTSDYCVSGSTLQVRETGDETVVVLSK